MAINTIKMETKKSIDERVYNLACECKEAVYSNVDHKEFIRQLASKLEKLARDINVEQFISMQESSYNGL